MKLDELSRRACVAPRQIRYLIAEGFVPAPDGGRARASYGPEHLAAIRRYSRLKGLGFPPAAVRLLLQTREGVPFPLAPGITLVVSPDLVASGAPAAPLIERLRSLLPDILDEHKGDNP